MEALVATLAAFRPDTKARLRKNGLITPTLQMLFRRTSKLVENESDYFKAKHTHRIQKRKNRPHQNGETSTRLESRKHSAFGSHQRDRRNGGVSG